MKYFWKHPETVAKKIASPAKLLIVLDFDGTLSPLAETPGQARLDPRFKAILKELSALKGVSIFVLSGRALPVVKKMVGLRGIYYGGNHGMETVGKDFRYTDPKATQLKDVVKAVTKGLKVIFPTGSGVLIENKGLTASIHYRQLEGVGKRFFFKRMHVVKVLSKDLPVLWRKGHEVIEILPREAMHKGDAVIRLSKKLSGPVTLAVGDDATDEDMFRALGSRGISIRVMPKLSSHAQYYLKGQQEVLQLLKFIGKYRRIL
jgi:trehalose-phosphatase